MKNLRLLTFFSLFLFSQGILAAATKPGFQVLRSSERELVLVYSPAFKSFDSVQVNGEWLFKPVFDAAGERTATPGAPALYSGRELITVPAETGFRITKVEAVGVRSFSKKIIPSASLSEAEGNAVLVRNPDAKLYGNLKNTSWAQLDYAGIAGRKHVASIDVLAVRFNGNIEIPSKIIIHIAFDPAPLARYKGRDLGQVPTLNDNIAPLWAKEFKAAAKLSGDKVLSTGKWLKVKVQSEGIYRISSSDLTGMGITISPDDIKTIKLIGNGGKELPEQVSAALQNVMNEQPVIVRTNSSGELESIIFYASTASGFDYESGKVQHYINSYSAANSYLLTWGGSEGRRAEFISQPEGPVQNSPRTYIRRIFNEEEINSPYRTGSGRRWFGKNVDPSLPVVYTTQLDGLAEGSILLRYNVAHRSPDFSRFIVKDNGETVSETEMPRVLGSYVDAASTGAVEARYPSSLLRENRSVLSFFYTGTSSSGGGFVDWFEYHYPAHLAPIGNEIEFFTDKLSGITEYSINGFSGEIFGFDVTNRAQPGLIQNKATTGGMFIFRVNTDTANPKRFFVSSNLRSAQLETVELAGLRESAVPYHAILITHPDLLASANEYKQYREKASDISIMVVTTDQIYNEFNSGVADPTAIRDFIAYSYARWTTAPQSVILWGDGHYDYKNVRSSTPNYIFPYESLDDDGLFQGLNTTTIDDYFVRVAGNDAIIDLAIGRLPIASPDGGRQMVEKIRHYEQNSSQDQWRTFATLVADDGPTSNGGTDGSMHQDMSENLSSLLTSTLNLQQKKIYLAEYPTENLPNGRRKPRVSEDLINSINNSGSVFVSWFGHGNPRVWAHEEIFERESTIPLLTNMDKLFFLTAATCDFGRFDAPEVQSGAELLVTSTKGGAIGAFSTSRVVFASENEVITRHFYTYLSSSQNGRFPTLGEAYLATKTKLNGGNHDKFFLLADPTMKLLLPEYKVRIDSINGMAINDSTIAELKGLSRVNISGTILNYAGDTDTSFNGTAIVSMFDSNIADTVRDEKGDLFKMNKLGGALNKGAYKILRGQFSAEFVLPKDISFGSSEGTLFAYGFSNDDRYAKGSSSAFRVSDIDSMRIADNEGPGIGIFLDSREFRSGNLVRRSPLLIVDLEDGTGLNTTGSGIGHNIEAWLDDEAWSIKLTDLFVSSLDNHLKGSVEKQLLNLAPGRHTIRVRAWDVINNFSEAEVFFRVAESDRFAIADNLSNSPNPVNDHTVFTLQHNQSEPFSLSLNIFTPAGQLVRSFNETISTLHSASVSWDGRDQSGASVSQGVYIYTAVLSARDGSTSELTGKLVVIK